MKKAFTLIELIVVVGILVVLVGTLVAALSGGTDAARAARCLTNLKNLATACNSYAMAHQVYPLAGSVETRSLARDESSAGEIKQRYSEAPGWISWDSRGAYQGKTTSHVASSSWFTSAYNEEEEVRQYALTNGILWKYLSGTADVYVCPSHRKILKHKNPLWSYVMNQKFGYDYSFGAKAVGAGIEYGSLARADRTLLFAELQFLSNDKIEVDTDASAGIKNDCTLQYVKQEVIGCNHANGKRGLCAHVVFADGHVEKLSIPATRNGENWSIKLGRGELEDLTKWLCQGKDVSFNGSRYEKLQD